MVIAESEPRACHEPRARAESVSVKDNVICLAVTVSPSPHPDGPDHIFQVAGPQTPVSNPHSA